MKKLILIILLCEIGFCGNALLSKQIPDISGKNGFSVVYSSPNNIPTYNIEFSAPLKLPTVAFMGNLTIYKWEKNGSISVMDSIVNTDIKKHETKIISDSGVTIETYSGSQKKIKIVPNLSIPWKNDDKYNFIVLLQTWQNNDSHRFGNSSPEYHDKTDDLRVLLCDDGFTITCQKPDSGSIINAKTLVSFLILYNGN